MAFNPIPAFAVGIGQWPCFLFFFVFFQLTKPYGLRVQGIEIALVLLISSRPP
jgi:hypothetical protein